MYTTRHAIVHLPFFAINETIHQSVGNALKQHTSTHAHTHTHTHKHTYMHGAAGKYLHMVHAKGAAKLLFL